MKISRLGLGLIVLAAMASAQAGFYTGAGAGIRPMAIQFSNLSVLGVKVHNLDINVTRPAGDLFFGYDHVFTNGIYIGGEAYYEYVNIDPSVSAEVNVLGVNVNETVSAKLSYNIDLSLLLGYQISKDDIVYSRLGVIGSKLNYSASQAVNGLTTNSASGDHLIAAGQFGLGAIHKFTKHFSMRAEYTYTRYPNEDINIGVHIPGVGHGDVSFTPKVSVNAVTLGLIYHF